MALTLATLRNVSRPQEKNFERNLIRSFFVENLYVISFLSKIVETLGPYPRDQSFCQGISNQIAYFYEPPVLEFLVLHESLESDQPSQYF